MPIAASDIKIYKTTGGLGGAITATEAISGQSGNIFDTFSGAETSTGGTFYACVYVKNEHGSLTATAVEALLASETDHDGVNISIAKGSSAVDGEEQTIANENTAPSGVTFDDTDTTTTGAVTSDPTQSLPDLPSGSHVAMWIRMEIDAATAAKTGYLGNIEIAFDTPE